MLKLEVIIGTNLPAPINVGSTEQTKAGNLIIGGLLKIGQYSSAPTGSTGALYYDTTANEFKGYKSTDWDSLGGASLWTQIGNDIYYNLGNVGIGTTTPSGKLEINGTAPTGSELVTNGTFTGSANGWTLGSDATYVDNAVTVTYTGGNPQLTTNFAVELDKTYLLTFTLSNVVGDTVYCYGNLSSGTGGPFSNGTHTYAFESFSTGTDTMYFESWNWNMDGTWTLDDVSIKEIVVSPALKVIGYTGNTVLSLSGDILRNTSIGLSALHSNTYGEYNTAVGEDSLYSNTIGSRNTAIGNDSLLNNTSGGYNTAIGYWSLLSNTTGTQNIAIGAESLGSNTTGGYNIAIGVFSLDANTTGGNNTAVGQYALYKNEGSYNTAIGSNAGRYNTGSNNTMIGYYAGAQIPGASFSNNVLLGYKAGGNLTTGSNNIVIGYNVNATSTTSANTLNIGNLIFATGVNGAGYTLSTGNVGIGTTGPTSRLHLAGNISAASWTTKGIQLQSAAATYTDTGVAGTRATATASSFGIPTYAATSTVTITDAINVYIAGAPTAGTNVTQTRSWGLYQAAGNTYFAGNVGIGTTTPAVKFVVAGQVQITGGTPGAGKVLVSDSNGLGTWAAGNWAVPTSVTYTSITHDGNFGGYQAMNTWIQTNGCSGYHVCDSVELTRWAQLGGSAWGWYNTGVAWEDTGQAVPYYYDCSHWSTISETHGGYTWNSNQPQKKTCATSYNVACCKY